jgi:DNA-binding CsgD family transcriptional regulator
MVVRPMSSRAPPIATSAGACRNRARARGLEAVTKRGENETVGRLWQSRDVVGRTSELQELPRFLDVLTDGPAALVLEGDAGIGKTALWSFGVRLASEREYNVLSCRTTQAEGQLPFVVLGDLFEHVPEQVLASLPEPQRRGLDVAMLRAEWEGPAIERRAVALGVLGVLRKLAEEGPVVVAVDDLQWLDPASAATLEFGLRRLDSERIGLLATRRGGDGETFLGLAVAVPLERLRRLELGPLDRESLGRLLIDRLDMPLSPPALVQVHRVSAGNPFLALEIARALERKEVRVVPGEPFPVPQSLRELVRDRLERLPAAGREVALVLAAIAQPTLARLGEAAAAAAGAQGTRGLHEALAAGIIEVEGERVRFTHPLIGSIVYSEASPAQRRELHAHLARLADDVEERARHLSLAETGRDAAIATLLEQAAMGAHRRGAPDAAADLLERAAALTPEGANDAHDRRQLDAAERHLEAGATERARDLFERISNEARERQLRLRAAARLGVTRILTGDVSGATRAFNLARSEAGDADSIPPGIEEGLAWTWEFRGDTIEAAKHARAAISLAEQQGDVVGLVGALASTALFEARSGPTGWARIERALSLAAEAEALPIGRSHPTRIYAQLLMGKGEMQRGCALLGDLYKQSLERGSEGSLAIVASTLCDAETRVGRWADAAAHAREGYLSTLGTGQLAQRIFMLKSLTLLDALHGEVTAVEARSHEARELIAHTDFNPLLANIETAVGLLELSLGDAASAHNTFAPLNDCVAGAGRIRDSGWFRFLADDAEALVALGELDAARETLAKLDARRYVLLDRAWTAQAFVRCRGLIALAAGDAETATHDLVHAVRLSEHSQEPFERARNLLALGRAQRRQKQRRAARESLSRAREIFERLGAPLWHDRAVEELARIGGRQPRLPGLTPTEQRVAELAAEGLTNREIAASAYLSVNTVQAYLKRIYRELGIRSRTELARKLPPRTQAKSTDSGVSSHSPRS